MLIQLFFYNFGNKSVSFNFLFYDLFDVNAVMLSASLLGDKGDKYVCMHVRMYL